MRKLFDLDAQFVEKNQCYSFTTNEGRERFLRLMFSLRVRVAVFVFRSRHSNTNDDPSSRELQNAVTQFPSGFEYNLRSIDRMVKHSLHVTLLFPWKVDDLTKPHYINASFFAAPFERTPNPMFEKLVKSDQELKSPKAIAVVIFIFIYFFSFCYYLCFASRCIVCSTNFSIRHGTNAETSQIRRSRTAAEENRSAGEHDRLNKFVGY